MDIHIGELIEKNNLKGVVFNLTEDPKSNNYPDPPHLIAHIRWEDGSLSEVPEVDLYCESDGFKVVTPKIYVNVYIWDKAYGGHEEGGWWYDTYTPEEEYCKKCATEAEAEEVYEKLLAECEEENEGRRPVSSVLSQGQYVVTLEAWPAEHSPKTRPHYE